jgi:hypothetical protein
MTGQGSKQFEQIKRGREQAKGSVNSSTGTLDLNRRYKTAGGHTVRSLRIVRTNKSVIGGKVSTSTYYHNIIAGQVLTQNQWLPAEWNERGQHPQEQYTLVEQMEDTIQGILF